MSKLSFSKEILINQKNFKEKFKKDLKKLKKIIVKSQKISLLERSKIIKIIEAPLTYEGIRDLYLSCPAESQI